MESAFLRMWDVPRSLIFCSSCIVMLPRICCIYLSNLFFISPRAPIATRTVEGFHPYILSISILRSLHFDSFSVTLTEVFFPVGVVIYMNRHFFPVCSWFQCLVCWLYLTICLHWNIPLDCDVVFFCHCLGLMFVPFLSFLNIHLFCCNGPLELCSPYSPMCAFLEAGSNLGPDQLGPPVWVGSTRIE